jgi:hypothetical protein
MLQSIIEHRGIFSKFIDIILRFGKRETDDGEQYYGLRYRQENLSLTGRENHETFGRASAIYAFGHI